MAKPLGMIKGGGTVVHYMYVNAAASLCGMWSEAYERVPSVPDGCRMCRRCSRRDGLSLECGCDIGSGTLHKDGVTAWCNRCGLHVNLIREAPVA